MFLLALCALRSLERVLSAFIRVIISLKKAINASCIGIAGRTPTQNPNIELKTAQYLGSITIAIIPVTINGDQNNSSPNSPGIIISLLNMFFRNHCQAFFGNCFTAFQNLLGFFCFFILLSLYLSLNCLSIL